MHFCWYDPFFLAHYENGTLDMQNYYMGFPWALDETGRYGIQAEKFNRGKQSSQKGNA